MIIDGVRFKEINSDEIRVKQLSDHGIFIALFAFGFGLPAAITLVAKEPEGFFWTLYSLFCLLVLFSSVFTDLFKRVVIINRKTKTLRYSSIIPQSELECSVYELDAAKMRRTYRYGVPASPQVYVEKSYNDAFILFSVYSTDVFMEDFNKYLHYLDNFSWLNRGPAMDLEQQIRLMKIPYEGKNRILKKRDKIFSQLSLKTGNQSQNKQKPKGKKSVRYRKSKNKTATQVKG